MYKLSNKHILVGVTGGIAAYKAAELVRMLNKSGAIVRVAMTRGACEFITPLTLQALSGNPVHTDLLSPEAEAGMSHIELARWADAILIAPASADFIAQLATGQGGDLLSTVCLATRASICLAPAMNKQMWANVATQKNIVCLQKRTMHIFGPDTGVQACGEIGVGRMLEPQVIAEELAGIFQTEILTGRRVLITAGPTRESIDPVRYISNFGSGKMGFALAAAASEAGAEVSLIAGPVSLPTPDRVQRIDVGSAVEMEQAVLQILESAPQDIFISSAAVCDYRAEGTAICKIKKNHADTNETLTLKLVRNPDILMTVSRQKKNRPFTVGFAAETHDVIEYAAKKMKNKSLDMIIANDVSDANIGFNSENNLVSVLGGDKCIPFPLMSKTVLARRLIALIAEASCGTGVACNTAT